MPWVARRLRIPMRVVEAEPWDISVRLREEPGDVRRYVVHEGSRVDGLTIRDLPLGEHAWISLVVRDGKPVQARGSLTLAAGDELLALVETDAAGELDELFGNTT